MTNPSELVVEARAWAYELEGVLFDGAPVAEVGLIRRLADALVEAEKVRRLHEVATQRTVELAAVIEKALRELDMCQETSCGMTLATVNTAAVLAERDAEKWEEGVRMALEAAEDTTDSFGNLYRIDWLNRIEHELEQNPYRSEEPTDG